MSLRFLLSLYLLLSVVSCGVDTEGEAPPEEPQENQVLRRPLDVSGSYVFNPVTGDSIKPILDQNGMPFATMKPTPAKGRIEEFFQQPTKVAPAQWGKLDKERTSNIRPIQVDIIQKPLVYDTLTVVKDDTYVLKSAIGDTIPTGIPVKIEGKKTPVKYPQPVSSLPPELHFESGLNLKNLGVDQGLSSETTSGLAEDRYGNKWISYLGMGLSKYDGHSFWHFTEKEGLPTNHLWGIWEARDGNLWLNTLHEGVIVFDGQSFTNYSAKEGFPGNGVRDIFEDSKGNIWVMRRYGVSKYDGEAFTHFTTKEGLVDNTIIRVYEDKEGIIWMVGFGKVSRYDGASFTNFAIRHPEGTGYINPFFEDHNGHLWLSSEDELFRYDGTSFARFPANLREFRLYWEEDTTSGHIWIAFYDDHIYKFDGENFWEYAIADEIKGSSIERIEKDEAGNIWFCTTGAGVYILNENSFRSTPNFDGQTKRGGTNRRWIIVSPGELSKYEDGHFWRLAGSDPRASIGPVLEDRNQNVWMGLYRGLAKYDGQRITYYRADTNRDLFTTQAITEDHLGNIWLARNHGMIVKYDGEEFLQYGAQDGLPPNRFNYSMEDKQHNLWFCSAGGGLVKFNGASFTVFSEKEGLSSNNIISMAEDQEGNIWLGTDGRGLMKYDGTCFTYYTENEGLSHNMVTSIIVGPKNQIWVGTGNGLNVLVPKGDQQTPDTIEDPTEAWIQNEYTIYPFSKQDGLLDNMVSWNTLSIDENNVFSGLLNGRFFQLGLNHFTLPQAPISVQLDRLDINGRSVDFRATEENLPSGLNYTEVLPFFNYPSNPTFSYRNNHLTFHYSATDWTAPHKVQYSYRMANAGEAWSVPSSETKADFRNLPPGRHTFEVRAMGQSQKWSEPFVYSFRILPPWWKTWWAYTCYLILIAALIYSLYRYQLGRQLQKQETENLKALDAFKNELYTNITHEFRTPLTVISGMADQITEPVKTKELIKRNSLSLLNLVNQILDLRKLELGKLKLDLVQAEVVQYFQYLMASYEAMAELKGVKLHFIPKEKELFMDFDQEKLLRIVSNLLSNAIKFTPEGGQVYLMLEKSTLEKEAGEWIEALYLSVSDTGTGIPQEQQAHIFDRFYQVEDTESTIKKYQYRGPGSNARKAGSGIGLALTKDLITLMGGTISLESTPGKGSTFTVLLPVSREALKVEIEQQTVEGLSMAAVDQAAVEKVISPFSTKAASGESGLSLLIIEDNQDVQQYLITLLEAKYTLYLASDGEEGIDMALEHIPDLIISDVMMPKKDGLEVCDTLKNDDRTSHIPIVLLTAKTSVESRIQGLERGADAYLAKPFNEKELFIRLEKLAELRRLLQQRYQHLRPPADPVQPAASADFTKEDDFMARLQKIVEGHLSDADFGPTQLCKAMGMSRSHLHLKIKALTNRSTSIFIRTIRLHKAKELLEQGELNVTQVASEVGFNDLSYFSKKFTEEFGVNPQKVIPS
ncbi:MAG: response regulator [Phaeodactylibacter sp.]|nr:response regulator [Phaeodactylibacter sp.]